MNNRARFGPAGTAESFASMGYKKTVQIPGYLEKFGLGAYEYQCGHGLKANFQTCEQLGQLCRQADIRISLHTPYYISLSSAEQEKRDNSIAYLLESARVVTALGGERMVVHSGSCGKMPREDALALAKDTLARAQAVLDENGFPSVRICPETMGKMNQLGTLEEVMELCLVDERFLPCIDFGHLNARTLGGIQTQADFAAILDTIENRLGSERLQQFHSHFSQIEYTEKGGEKRHLNFGNGLFGPEYEPLAELIARKSLTPVMICESAGRQTEDAAAMQAFYRNALAPAENDARVGAGQ